MIKQGFKSTICECFATRLTENVWSFFSVSDREHKSEEVDKGFGKKYLCGLLSIWVCNSKAHFLSSETF